MIDPLILEERCGRLPRRARWLRCDLAASADALDRATTYTARLESAVLDG
ncbi:hypothetical protein [Nocardia sp. NPDC047654]